MAKGDTAQFDEGVRLALEKLGFAPSEEVIDAVLDPAGACAALDTLAGDSAPSDPETPPSVLIRVGRELGPERSGYGPAPEDPLWLRVERGSLEVTLAPLRSEPGGEISRRRIAAVVLEAEAVRCCNAPGCTLEKAWARAWIELKGGSTKGGASKGSASKGGAPLDRSPARLLLVEALAGAAGDARTIALAVGARLARATGAPLREGDAAVDLAPGLAISFPGPSEPRSPWRAGQLARFALRAEGDRIVLRDHGSLGPRAASRRNVGIGVALMIPALGLWALLATWISSGRGAGSSAAVASVAIVLSLASYAFLGVARFAHQYAARSAPLLAVGQGRFIVMPWVNRGGAVDARPEGRLGAAIPLGELRGVAVVRRDAAHAVELDTDHGKMDVLASDRPEVAALWSEVLPRALAHAAHPVPRASARQRARARAQAGADPAIK
jgi:hypothetical protein